MYRCSHCSRHDLETGIESTKSLCLLHTVRDSQPMGPVWLKQVFPLVQQDPDGVWPGFGDVEPVVFTYVKLRYKVVS